MSIAWKDIQVFLRERGQLVTLFVLPMVFIIAFSAVFSLQDDNGELKALPVVNLDPDGDLATDLIDSLSTVAGIEAVAYSPEQGRLELEEEAIQRLLIIPAGFSTEVAAGQAVIVRLVNGAQADASETEAMRTVLDGLCKDLSLQSQLIAGLEQMGDMMSAAPGANQAFAGNRIVAQAESQFERAKHQPLIAVETILPEVIRRDREEFSAVDLSVPGFAVLFVFLTATTTAMSIYEEKRNGSFRRLMAAPIGKAGLLVGKMLPNICRTLAQIIVVFGISSVLLPAFGLGRLSLGNHPLALILISLLIALCSTCLGLLLAAICRTESQISALGSVALWVMGAVSGAFIPQFILGDLLGTIGRAIPHYWAIAAYQDILVRNQGLSGIATEALILAGFTLLFACLGAWRFRFER